MGLVKPFDHQETGGGYCNQPVAFDGSGTPKTSPVAAGATVELTVPASAARLNLLASGSNAATVTIKDGSTAKDGTITIPNNVQVHIDCAGMGAEEFPNIISITAGATSPVSFWFDCIRPDGA